jgi:hypothetical protein
LTSTHYETDEGGDYFVAAKFGRVSEVYIDSREDSGQIYPAQSGFDTVVKVNW